MTLCASSPTCLTAQFDDDNNNCYLKSGQAQLNPAVGISTIDPGNGCIPSDPETGAGMVNGCTVQCDTDSPAWNLDWGVYTGSYAACASLCQGNAACATAQYSTGNGFCYQKEQVNGRGFTPQADTVSLVCPSNGYQAAGSD
jgi:hypothetical protein